MGEDPRRWREMDAGLRTIERYRQSNHLSARSADSLDNMVRENDYGGLGARYLAAVGDPSYESAFEKILRNPTTAHFRFTAAEVEAVQRVTRIEQERALVEGTPSAGGMAVPLVLDPTIIHTSSGQINPLREISSVIQIGTNLWKGVASDAPAAAYAPEAAEVGDASPTLVQPTIQVATGRAFVPASFEVWQDWAGIVDELSRLLAQSRDILDATKMLLGGGPASNEPTGLLSIGTTGALSATQRIQTAVSATYALGDVYLIKQAVMATVFGPNSTW